MDRIAMARKQRVFIASSSERREIAYAVQEELEEFGDIEATVWFQGLFGLSKTTIEALDQRCGDFDFAVFIFSFDDVTRIRAEELASVRDNVLFELGLFIGRIGRSRCFIVEAHSEGRPRLPTDLLGIARATFTSRDDGNLRAALGRACGQMRRQISQVVAGDTRQSAVAVHARCKRPIDTRQQVENAAQSIWLLSESPNRVLGQDLRDIIEKKLELGCNMRFIMLRDSEKNLEQVTDVNEFFKDDADLFLSKMREAKRYFRKLRGIAKPGQLEMREWDGPVRFGLLITDARVAESALCRLELRLKGTQAVERPNMYFTPSGQPNWFSLFVNQFEKVWEEAVSL